MANLASVLKAEIRRISSKVAREILAPVQRVTAAQRRHIAALRRQVAALEKELRQQRAAAAASTRKKPDPEKVRFYAKGLASHRKRLALSAHNYGRLLGVSGQSIYHWEAGKSVPRKGQVAAIAALRAVGKREALARLSVVSRQ